jgi:flavin reductase (DIM6/NTAB) family NADH-FMN oxidoreductase RutF
MAKIKIAPGQFSPPMPVALVGTLVDGIPNFMTAGWLCRVNFQPPLLAIAIGTSHYTPAGIMHNRTFSVCIPDFEMVEKTDYCGLVSGRRVNKSGVFNVFYGELETAPMIVECPLCVECTLQNVVDNSTNHLFIGEIVAAHAEERFLTNGQPDFGKIRPLILTMPENAYWALGERVGTAWDAGKGLKQGGS